MLRRRGLVASIAVAALTLAGTAVQASAASRARPAQASRECQLRSAKGDIKHVIYLQLDKTHFLRDNANVPSDLEKMPNLPNLLRSNGALLTNDRPTLISRH